MAKWQDLLKGVVSEGSKQPSGMGNLDVALPPAVRMQKDSRGRIDEADSWIISSSSKYLDREIRVTGVSEFDLWRKYCFNSWIRAIVDKIIKETVKYRVVAKAKDSNKAGDKVVQAKVAEVQALLDDPNNKVESFEDIRRKYLRDILVYDAGAVEIVYKDGKPYELYDVKGSLIRLDLDKHGNFKNPDRAYVLVDRMNAANILAAFSIRELMYMIANPVSGSAYGLSPIETLWDEICNDDEACSYNKKLLENSGMISGVLSFKGMGIDALKKAQRYWKEEMKRKGVKLIVTNNDDVKFIKVAESNKDMQFLEFQKWVLNKLMAVYGMQPIVLGVIDDTTGKLNSSEQREQFKQDAILPLLKLEAYRLTNVLVLQGFDYDDVVITHEEPADINEEFDLEKCKVGCQFGVVTIDEARAWLNLQPVGDDRGKELVNSESLKYIQTLVEKDAAGDDLSKIRQEIETLLGEDGKV